MKYIKTFNESIKSDISKRIGLNPNTTATIPSVEEIENLTKRAKEGDENAFEVLFRINRFAKTPNTDEEIDRLNLAVKGFRESQHLYENLLETASYAPGDDVLIKYWAAGGELVPVHIESVDKGMCLISFGVEGNPFPGAPTTTIKTSDIVGIYRANNEPNMGTSDWVKRSTTKISNDLVINNYPKQI